MRREKISGVRADLREALADASLVPMVVAVTSHDNLVPDDESQIRARVRDTLRRVERTAREAPLILLTGLTSPTDRLVADEAMIRNWAVVGVLPCAAADVRASMTDDTARASFDEYQAKCWRVIEIPAAATPAEEPTSADEVHRSRMREQNIFIVRQAQLVIALWDGVPAKPGEDHGTAAIVELCRHGPPTLSADLLSSPETTSLIHIPVRRLSDPDHKPKRVPESKLDKAYRKSAREFSRFNVAARKNRIDNEPNHTNSIRSLLPLEEQGRLGQIGSPLARFFADADSVSVRLRRKRDLAVRVVSIAVVLGAFFQAAFTTQKEMLWLIAYGAAAALGYGLYLSIFRLPLSQIGDRYIEYRAIAEGLRIQFFWQITGIHHGVAEEYQQLVKTEVGWVREALRNIQFMVAPLWQWEPPSSYVPSRIDVGRYWVDGQERYYLGTTQRPGKALQCKIAAGRIELLANVALTGALLLVGVAAVASMMLMPVHIKIAASAFSTSFFLLGGVIKGYASAMGYAEQSVSYELMGALFRNARSTLERNAGNEAIEEQCLFTLGKFALDENASWLLMHRKNAFQVSG